MANIMNPIVGWMIMANMQCLDHGSGKTFGKPSDPFFLGGGDFVFFFVVAAEGSLTPTNDSNDIELAYSCLASWGLGWGQIKQLDGL